MERPILSEPVRRARLLYGVGTLLLGWLALGHAAAQSPVALGGRVVDGVAGIPVAEASVVLARLGADGSVGRPQRVATAWDGTYAFVDLAHGRYRLSVERFGYRTTTIEVALDRDRPLSVSILMEPDPLLLDAVVPNIAYPRRGEAPYGRNDAVDQALSARVTAVRVRQRSFLSTDVRVLRTADVRESNTLLEDDLFRALQLLPGVGARDGYSARPWTRGASADQTAVYFDGVPLIGAFHALGVFGGLDSDILGSATWQPGVPSAAVQGGAAGMLAVETPPPSEMGRASTLAVSPISARFSVTGHAGDRIRWVVGARRSYIDATTLAARGLTQAARLPYAFGDVTGRLDLVVTHRSRIEASFFRQDDHVSGDIADLAYGNQGDWGAAAQRVSLVTDLGTVVVRNTVAASRYGASVDVVGSSSLGHTALHPTTENHYRAMMWETGVYGRSAPGSAWSAGLRTIHVDHAYDGPGIDPAALLTPEEFARRGIADLTPSILGLQHASLLEKESAQRLALWAEGRRALAASLEIEGGLRLETGDPVGGGKARLAPRLQARFRQPGSPLALSAAYGRVYQYLQAPVATDVLRTGLRANDVLMLADGDTPAVRSDVLTVGAEAWEGADWLLGATAWLRASSGMLVPDPTPGIIDGARAAVSTVGIARGLALSVRKLDGPIRGFANYTFSRSRYRTATRAFDVSEDRRHMANIGVVGDVWNLWHLAATLRAASGAPYTRLTVIEGCPTSLRCETGPRVLYGAPNAQRGPGYVSLDLMGERTFAFRSWSLSVYSQLRNALGIENAETYHSSCACGDGSPASVGLRDRFDAGLPRLVIVGLRMRFLSGTP